MGRVRHSAQRREIGGRRRWRSGMLTGQKEMGVPAPLRNLDRRKWILTSYDWDGSNPERR